MCVCVYNTIIICAVVERETDRLSGGEYNNNIIIPVCAVQQ